MRSEVEIREKRDELLEKIERLKRELSDSRGERDNILAEIGEQVILIWWFNWVLGLKEDL